MGFPYFKVHECSKPKYTRSFSPGITILGDLGAYAWDKRKGIYRSCVAPSGPGSGPRATYPGDPFFRSLRVWTSKGLFRDSLGRRYISKKNPPDSGRVLA